MRMEGGARIDNVVVHVRTRRIRMILVAGNQTGLPSPVQNVVARDRATTSIHQETPWVGLLSVGLYCATVLPPMPPSGFCC